MKKRAKKPKPEVKPGDVVELLKPTNKVLEVALSSKKNGRPTVRTPELIENLLHSISEGMTLLAWCREDDDRPHASTIYVWLDNDIELSRRFARARMHGFDALAMQCVQIANEPDWVEEVSESFDADGVSTGRTVTRRDNTANKKVRIWTILQLLAKWDPKRYGEKLGVGQAEGLEPIKMLTNEERLQKIRALFATVKQKGKR